MDSRDSTSLLDELLPGIPNDITVDVISPKLSWRHADRLSSMNHSSQQGIQRGLIYRARVQHQSTETLLVIQISDTKHLESPPGTWLFLYSLQDETFYRLPPVPHLLSSYKYIALDTSLYILGGKGIGHTHQSVYVLDLAGEKQWKQCASMLQQKKFFGCGVLGGKIYVFGGTTNDGLTDGSEMYDPKANAWFPRKPMLSSRMHHRVSSTHEELIVHGGYKGARFREAFSWQVYHPLRDDWRVVEPYRLGPADWHLEIHMQDPFMWQGDLYSMRLDSIHRYDTEKDSWRRWLRISCEGLGPVNSVRILPISIVPVNNELLVTVLWVRTDNKTNGGTLLLSKGFGNRYNQVVWSKAPHWFEINALNTFTCTVQL